jgi:uncharacterized Zn-binding protein involved in type VI secretion
LRSKNDEFSIISIVLNIEGRAMTGEIIRLGDPTSHGGKVLEGSPADICFGKPIAFVGHKTYCPACKGTFPIIEGSQTASFYGKGVALAGMKTGCGATLIATQFTDTVECGGGGGSTAKQAESAPEAEAPATVPATHAAAPSMSGAASLAPLDSKADHQYDLAFRVQDGSTGKALAHTRYRITLDDSTELVSTTDADGMTEKVCSNHPQNATLEVPFYDHESSTHTDNEHSACDC